MKKLPLAVHRPFTYNSAMALRFAPVDDQSGWELFVLRNAPEALFQSWSWGDVQKRLGATVTRYGIFEKDKLIGVMQTVLVRARRGSFLHVRHGPIIDQHFSRAWKPAIAFLSAEAKRLGCWFVRVSPLLKETPASQALFRSLHARPAAIHRMDGEYCWVLDLDVSTDQLMSAMRKSTRYEIRHAEKDHVKVYSTQDPKYLKDFFSLYEATSSRHGFVPHTGIREEFSVFAKQKQAMLYVGKHEDKALASAIILYYGNQAIYHHGASVSNRASVSYAVQWEAIQEAKKRGMKVYNFWGIAPQDSPKHPWRGITLFKTGFGGRLVEYTHAQDIPVSPWYIFPRMVETVRRMVKGYD